LFEKFFIKERIFFELRITSGLCEVQRDFRISRVRRGFLKEKAQRGDERSEEKVSRGAQNQEIISYCPTLTSNVFQSFVLNLVPSCNPGNIVSVSELPFSLNTK